MPKSKFDIKVTQTVVYHFDEPIKAHYVGHALEKAHALLENTSVDDLARHNEVTDEVVEATLRGSEACPDSAAEAAADQVTLVVVNEVNANLDNSDSHAPADIATDVVERLVQEFKLWNILPASYFGQEG